MYLLNSSTQGFLPPMLVFVQSIDRARELFHELVYEGINVDVIHAERTQQQVGKGEKGENMEHASLWKFQKWAETDATFSYVLKEQKINGKHTLC